MAHMVHDVWIPIMAPLFSPIDVWFSMPNLQPTKAAANLLGGKTLITVLFNHCLSYQGYITIYITLRDMYLCLLMSNFHVNFSH